MSIIKQNLEKNVDDMMLSDESKAILTYDSSEKEIIDEQNYVDDSTEKEAIKDKIDSEIVKLECIRAEIEAAKEELNELVSKKSLEEEKLTREREKIEAEKAKIYEERKSIFEKEKLINERIESNKAEISIKEKEIGYREREITCKLEQLTKKEKFCEELETKVIKRENDLSEKEFSFEQNKAAVGRLKSELEMKEKTVNELEESVNRRINDVIQKENDLIKRETKLNARESSENENLNAKKLEFEKQVLEEKKKILDALNEEISQTRKSNFDKINAENESFVKTLAERERKLKENESKLDAERDEFAFEREQVEAEKRNNNQNLRRIELLVQNKVESELSRMKIERESWERQRLELYNQIKDYEGRMAKFERIAERFGDDPQVIFDELRNKQERINELNQEIMNFDMSKVKAYDGLVNKNSQLEEEKEKYKERYHELQSRIGEIDSLQFDIESLSMSNRNLEKQKEDLEDEIKFYKERINRLSTSADPADRETRIAEIKKGFLPVLTEEIKIKSMENQPESELAWLMQIENKCKEYEIKFPHRILYAFHTALKISDWSTITVLAGVSGTGKSELPRLYSKFGGIPFINVPVQPNWDSKESMLGYYNSIDNRFEAQDVLRFLAQCTDKEGYGVCMAIVLLDEMNLAHVELYFAEFLSKLEERRGIKRRDVIPEIEVKLGSGMEPYGIKMARNILWTGTMNQDETTNSLSDKVLDRGIVINFPRPTELISRKEMKDMNDAESGPLLFKATWDSWLTRKIEFEGKQAEKIEEYRKIVNNINTQLEKVGRALGHRVWQSIEYYIANYPTVINEIKNISLNPELEEGTATPEFKEAVRTAFEDQIVQKIMPKLRGIETSGPGGEALTEIKLILIREGFDTLEEDFNRAMELGYGQFMWNSAKYIEKSEESVSVDAESNDSEDEE